MPTDKLPPLEPSDPSTDADKNVVLRDAINETVRADPTRFTTRSFAVLLNKGHSLRLINRSDPRQAISIPCDELDALRAILTGEASDNSQLDRLMSKLIGNTTLDEIRHCDKCDLCEDHHED